MTQYSTIQYIKSIQRVKSIQFQYQCLHYYFQPSVQQACSQLYTLQLQRVHVWIEEHVRKFMGQAMIMMSSTMILHTVHGTITPIIITVHTHDHTHFFFTYKNVPVPLLKFLALW